MVVQQIVRYGVLSDVPTVPGALNSWPSTGCRSWSPCWSACTCSPAARPAARPHRMAAGRAGRGADRVVLHPAVGDGRVRVFQIFLLWLRQRAFLQWLAPSGRDRRAFSSWPSTCRRCLTGSAGSSATRSGRSSWRCWASRCSGWPSPPWSTARRCCRWPSCGARPAVRRRVPGASVFARYAESAPCAASAHRPVASGWPPTRPGRPSSATSTTSTCRPSTRSAWCCGPARCSSGRTSWPTPWS